MTEELRWQDVAKRIRTALKKRSGKAWSVTGSRGTATGWITITANPNMTMTDEEQAELARLLAKETVHRQGERIPAASDYYREYLDRAEGRSPKVIGQPYWD